MIARIRNSYKNSENTKALVDNFAFLIMLKAASFVFPLITLPYLSKVIGVEKFGAIAFATAMMTFIETITDWGFNYTATRDVAKCRDDLKQVSRIFSEVIWCKLILAGICFLVLYIMCNYIPYLNNYKTLLFFTFAYIPGQIFFPEWLFQAFERMKYITILSLLSKLVFTILIFACIKEDTDYIYHPLLNAAGYIVSGIFALYIIFNKFRLRLIVPSFNDVYLRLKSSVDMFLSLIFPNLYTSISTVVLQIYCGESATGIYSGGKKMQEIMDQFTQVLSRTFFPFLARHKEKHYIYVYISVVVSALSCAIMFFGADLFVKYLLTPEFKNAATVIRIFSITPFFLFLMNTYGTNYLVIIGKENILRNIIIGCSILGFVLTCFLTIQYSYIGASVSIVAVWGIRGALTYYYAMKYKRNS
ncbi:flippase [Odoribacter sp. OttesenSCG-928-A06]|nr:flippase [Odoribacter sp. OttesenSCG-928-A06]